jgi:biopolymer transport protein ExbD
MSYFGLIATVFYLLVLLPLWTLQAWANLGPRGLLIHLVRPGVNAEPNPGIQPLVVRLESGGLGGRPSVYLDSRRVSWEDFDVALQKDINQRPPRWPVYLDGDPDMELGWAVQAIDIIRGEGAEVILLPRAPGSRSLRQR